jgi:Conserved hypothetical protein (DUF2461)
MSMQGYEADNPNIEFLRLKNFTIGRKLKDEEVLGPGSLDIIAGLVGTMAPFVSLILFFASFQFVEESRGSDDQASLPCRRCFSVW